MAIYNTEHKDQFVIAYVGDINDIELTASHGRQLAAMLNKGLILLYVCDPRYHCIEAKKAQTLLQQHIDQHPDTPCSYCVLSGDTRVAIEGLPTALNGVIAVAGVSSNSKRRNPLHPHEVLRNFSRCKIAFLTVQSSCSSVTAYKEIALGVDYHKESKEKLIWASYFARFNDSNIHVLYEDYKDEGLKSKWYNNMKFLNKFLTNLGLTFKPHIYTKQSMWMDMNALNFAHNEGYGLLVAVTTDTRERDFVEWFIGVQENRSIRNKYKMPVLYLNPRDDIYVMCD